jgi:hypothetical protein
MLHKNMTCFCKGHICLFTCYLISLSAPNKTGPAACFILKKQDQFYKVEKSDLIDLQNRPLPNKGSRLFSI